MQWEGAAPYPVRRTSDPRPSAHGGVLLDRERLRPEADLHVGRPLERERALRPVRPPDAPPRGRGDGGARCAIGAVLNAAALTRPRSRALWRNIDLPRKR